MKHKKHEKRSTDEFEDIMRNTEILMRKESESDILCCICLSPIGVSGIKRLDCTHKFHPACIDDWFNKNKNKKCPICNKKY